MIFFDGPADFPTIQEAINAANDGDTIFVHGGIYYENIVVNKSVSLIGENRSTTIIDGRLIGTVFHVMSDFVNIAILRYETFGSPKVSSTVQVLGLALASLINQASLLMINRIKIKVTANRIIFLFIPLPFYITNTQYGNLFLKFFVQSEILAISKERKKVTQRFTCKS
mgnify:CR=1 FL=1